MHPRKARGSVQELYIEIKKRLQQKGGKLKDGKKKTSYIETEVPVLLEIPCL